MGTGHSSLFELSTFALPSMNGEAGLGCGVLHDKLWVVLAVVMRFFSIVGVSHNRVILDSLEVVLHKPLHHLLFEIVADFIDATVAEHAGFLEPDHLLGILLQGLTG